MSTREWTMSGIQQEMDSQLKKTFFKLAMNLLITFITMYVISHSYRLLVLTYNMRIILLITQFILVVVLSRGQAYYMKPLNMKIVTIAYSILTGITLAPYIVVYRQTTTVLLAFVITVGIFVSMSLYGLITKRALYKMQSYLFGALIGLLIAMIASMFIRIPMFNLVLSIAGAILFTVYIAYDVQIIKKRTLMVLRNSNSDIMQEQIMDNFSTLGAFMLYIDFINLFIYILRIIGYGNDD